MKISVDDWRMIVPVLDEENSWKKMISSREFYIKLEKAEELLLWSDRYRKQSYADKRIIDHIITTRPSNTKENVEISDYTFFCLWIAMTYAKSFSLILKENIHVSKKNTEKIRPDEEEYIKYRKNNVIYEDKILPRRLKTLNRIITQVDLIFQDLTKLEIPLHNSVYTFFLDDLGVEDYHIDVNGQDLKKIGIALEKIKEGLCDYNKEEKDQFSDDILYVFQEIFYPKLDLPYMKEINARNENLLKHNFPGYNFRKRDISSEFKEAKSEKMKYKLLDDLLKVYKKLK